MALSKIYSFLRVIACALPIAAAFPSPTVAAQPLGPESAACYASSREAAFLVRISGFKTRKGQVRVQAYGSNPSEFLAKGKWIARVDLPVSSSGYMDVCLLLPQPGRYALAVRHDANANGKSDWNDGGGFSRNPRLSLLRLKPRYRDVVVLVGQGPTSLSIVLNYRRGLSIGPI